MNDAVNHLRKIIYQTAETCSAKKNTVTNYSPNQLPPIILKLIKLKHQTRIFCQLYKPPQDRN